MISRLNSLEISCNFLNIWWDHYIQVYVTFQILCELRSCLKIACFALIFPPLYKKLHKCILTFSILGYLRQLAPSPFDLPGYPRQGTGPRQLCRRRVAERQLHWTLIILSDRFCVRILFTSGNSLESVADFIIFGGTATAGADSWDVLDDLLRLAGSRLQHRVRIAHQVLVVRAIAALGRRCVLIEIHVLDEPVDGGWKQNQIAGIYASAVANLETPPANGLVMLIKSQFIQTPPCLSISGERTWRRVCMVGNCREDYMDTVPLRNLRWRNDVGLLGGKWKKGKIFSGRWYQNMYRI